MLGEASIAQEMSSKLLKAGVYIKGLWYPVVPKGAARLRAQVSAALSKNDIDRALEALEKVRQENENHLRVKKRFDILKLLQRNLTPGF